MVKQYRHYIYYYSLMKSSISITLAVVALLAASCNKRSASPVMVAPPIEVATPIQREVTLTREYPGYLAAGASIEITARVNGTLESRNYTVGERVHKGDLLFVIEPTLYQNAVAQAEATAKTAAANLEYARNNYERMKTAAASDAVSRIEVIQAETNVATSEAAASNAAANLSTAKKNLEYCYIRAPQDGVISLSDYAVGSYIAGAATPVRLATLYNDNIMYAYFDVTDNQWLRQQQRIDVVGKEEYITFTLGEDRYFTRKARMDYLSPDVQLSTGTLRVRAELENSDGFLKPGSYISVVLPYENVEKALLVKDASIGTDQLGDYLYIVNDSNIVQYRHIVTGNIVDDSLRIVTEGLRPGERYVTKALLKVRNGMRVKPVIK